MELELGCTFMQCQFVPLGGIVSPCNLYLNRQVIYCCLQWQPGKMQNIQRKKERKKGKAPPHI